MVRKLSLLLGLLFFVSFAAHAQGILSDKVEVFGGYSFMHNDNRPDSNLNGWEFSGQYKFTDWLGGVGDFDGHYGRTARKVQLSVRPADFLSGARIAVRPSPRGRSPEHRMAMAVTHLLPQRSALELTQKSAGRFTGASFRATGFTRVFSEAARTMAGFRRAL